MGVLGIMGLATGCGRRAPEPVAKPAQHSPQKATQQEAPTLTSEAVAAEIDDMPLEEAVLNEADTFEWEMIQALAASTNSPDDRENARVRTEALLSRNPRFIPLWTMRAHLALWRNDRIAGVSAMKALISLGAVEEGTPEVQEVVASFAQKDWLAEAQQDAEVATRRAAYLATLPPVPVEGKPAVIADLGMVLQPIAAGTGRMGSATGAPKEKPVLSVTLTRPYWLAETEVTQRQWTAVMGTSPAHFKALDHPVESVSWEDATSFCAKLTERERAAGRVPEGYAYQLPTEAQWEYACRAGSALDAAPHIERYAWFDKNGPGRTQIVATKEPNAWGLYDMYGNVWEWCRDWYADSYRIYSSGTNVVDPSGPRAGASRVVRGSSWNQPSSRCRASERLDYPADYRLKFVGFRVALSPL